MYYDQVNGVAMGSLLSSLIANLFMEEFEVKALSTAPSSCLWLRVFDDTLVIHKAEHSTHLHQHNNSQDPNIQFTVEQPGTDRCIPFMDAKSHQDQTTPSTPQHTGNQHTLINKSIGTASISLQLDTVCTTP